MKNLVQDRPSPANMSPQGRLTTFSAKNLGSFPIKRTRLNQGARGMVTAKTPISSESANATACFLSRLAIRDANNGGNLNGIRR